jgi:uncharacterized membrane protein
MNPILHLREIFSGGLLLILLLWLSQQAFEAQTYITLQVHGYQENRFQVLYDRGLGFNEADSASMAMPKEIPLTVPQSHDFVTSQVDNYRFEIVPLYFPLPSRGKLIGLRIDPGQVAGPVAIQNICLHNRYQSHCWQPDQIAREFSFSEDVQETLIRESDNLLILHIRGGDPRMIYQGDFAALHARFQQADWQARLAWHGLALLLAASVYALWPLLAGWRQAIQRPHTLLLLLGLPFGLILAGFNPPFQTPDEPLHFFRATHISQGQLVLETQDGQSGMHIPKNSLLTGLQLLNYFSNPDRATVEGNLQYLLNLPPGRHESSFILTYSLYSPLTYLPPALGVTAGRMLNLSWFKSMYLGRLASLLAWLGLMYLAVRITPIGRWLFVLLALTPMTLYQVSSLSADGLTISLAFVFVAGVLRLALDEEAVTPAAIGGVLLAGILLALCKQPYAVLLLLFFLIPPRHLGGTRRYLLFFGLLCLAGIGMMGLWLYSIRSVYAAFETAHGGKLAILMEPLRYAGIVWETTCRYGLELLSGYVGTLGWHNLPLPAWLVLLHLLMLAGYALTDATPGYALCLWRRALLLGVWLLAALVIYTSLYASWTPPGSPVIEGLQGRYFIPIAMLPALLLYRQTPPLRVNHAALTLLYTPLMFLTMLWVLAARYYV